ncbi:MAG TPA: ATP-binding protein [Bacteroidia bacterium]|jgi:two-component system nitrogen regulation sensor histidine kinase NtrY|nr:ATP-binding protein [Bacteroidia bacterium]
MSKKTCLWFSLGLTAVSLLCYFFSFVTLNGAKEKAEKNLSVLEKKAEVYLDSVHQHLHGSDKKSFVNYLSANFNETYPKEGIACFVYENDSLLYWTDSHAAVENYMLNVCLEKRLVKLKNGYYEVIRHPKNAYSPFQLYALILIKNNFPYENRYLVNEFNQLLQLPENAIMLEGEAPSVSRQITITNSKQQPVFLVEMKENGRQMLPALVSFLSLCGALFMFLYFFKKSFLPQNSLKGFIKWSAAVLSAIAILGLFIFKLNTLFIPRLWSFDVAGFPGLVFLLGASLLMLWFFSTLRGSSFNLKNGPIVLVLFLVFIFGIGLVVNTCVYKIFNKPYLAADLSEVIFSSSAQVYFSYILIFILLFCFVIFCETFLKKFPFGSQKNHWIIFCLSVVAVIIAHDLASQYDILKALWPGVLFLLVFFSKRIISNNRFVYGTLTCLFISFFVAYLTIHQKIGTDHEQRLNVAKQLASPKDEIAENLFVSVKNAILNDKELLRTIQKKEKGLVDVEQTVLRKYFNGYWDKYHISVCIFDSLCFPLVQHTQHLYNNNSYFDELINTKLVPSSCEKLFFNEQLKDKTFYLFKTPLESVHKPHLLYVVIESKKAAEYRGFPDLLLSRSVQFSGTDYSYAVYKGGQIHIKQGKYEYPNYFSYPDDPAADSWAFQQGGFNHLIYKPNANTKIIVSKNYSYFNDLFSTIGFMFLASSTVLLLLSFLNTFAFREENSLSVKIQHYAAIAIFALFIPVAISTVALVKRQTENANTDAIKEKTQMLADYLSVRLTDYDTLNNSHKEYVSYLLSQATGLFKNDVTVFHTNGEYYAASLPKLFEEGLVSKKLNPRVYNRILNGNENGEVYKESVGNLNFYSAYRLVKNRHGKSLCVVNLPYFSKQGELQSQLFSYLSALLNIYILAFMVVSLGVALLANWLTRPLRLLQKQFMQIGLNHQDNSIKYERNDEIGLLISAYNNMLIKLQNSADKLAQSEREGAWKEMARQVAHEIKNPLTPMKLSIQHVQRLMETNLEAAAEHMKKITPVLLEEIDALSHIATEFSNFSQLPAPKSEEIELVSFIQSVLPLYAANTKINIEFNVVVKEVRVRADKDQMLRVFNNLVNNAVQALSDNENGKIVLALNTEHQKVVVSVADNGVGIDESLKPKIFQPNFSTKSYGTGLGLAMCKRIIEQHGGQIWFDSKIGKGTVFYFTINDNSSL